MDCILNISSLSPEKIQEVLDRMDCYFFIKDKNGCYTYVNEAVCQLFARSREEIIGADDSQFFSIEQASDLIKNDVSVLNGKTVSNVEVNTLKSGEVKHYQNMKSPLFNSHNEVVGIFGLAIDISKTVARHNELEFLAIRDVLTGLYNRRFLELQLKHEIASFKRHEHDMSCLMLDVDGFKSINDRFGHSIGDYVLQSIGKTLLGTVREEDFCFRFGGDEFTILLPKTSLPDAYRLAERVRESVASKTLYSSTGHPFKIKISLGVASLQKGLEDQLLALADKALMEVKLNAKGKNTSYVFCDHLESVTSCNGCIQAGQCK